MGDKTGKMTTDLSDLFFLLEHIRKSICKLQVESQLDKKIFDLNSEQIFDLYEQKNIQGRKTIKHVCKVSVRSVSWFLSDRRGDG